MCHFFNANSNLIIIPQLAKYNVMKVREEQQDLCACEKYNDSLAQAEWSDQPCPFIPSRKYKQSKQHPFEILQGLVCSCGKEVAERIFSSDRMVGFWRLKSYKEVCLQLKHLNAFFEKHMAESVEKGLQMLGKLETNHLKSIESRMESFTLNDNQSGHKTKRRSNSTSAIK